MQIVMLVFFFTVIIFCFNSPGEDLHATSPIILDQRLLQGGSLGRSIEILEDREKKWSIEDIAYGAISSQFKPAGLESISLGYLSSAYWVRFSVINPSDKVMTWFLENNFSLFDKIELFIPSKKTFIKKMASDFFKPYSQKEIPHNATIFQLTTQPGMQRYYLRYEQRGTMQISLHAWSQKNLMSYITTMKIIYGIFYGILLVMLCYNFFLFLGVKENAYWYYVVNILTVLVCQLMLAGHAFEYLWPNHPTVNEILASFLILGAGTMLLFTRSYLSTKKNTPKFDMVIKGFIGLLIIALISSIILPYSIGISIAVMSLMFSIIICLIIGVVFMVKKSRLALFYSAGYSLLLIGVLIRSLKDVGVLPDLFITTWGNQIGNALSLIFFSFGLADKINVLKNNLSDMNVNLERKVNERTAELNAAMEELQAMNENLQSTMEELEATNEQLIQTRDALWGEMQLAKKIQTVLLPRDPRIDGYEIAAYLEPTAEVGGDYYDVIRVAGRDWLVIGDVSGHGIPAGLVMMMVQTAIQTALHQNPDLNPSGLLTIINNTITSNIQLLGESKYMTITVFAHIDNGIFHFAGLHQDLLVYRKQQNTVELIPSSGIWIGILDDITNMVTENSMTLEHGDVLLLFTDGITESFDSNNIMYTEEKLVSIFQQYGSKSPNEIKTAILDSLNKYECSDDVTILIIKRK